MNPCACADAPGCVSCGPYPHHTFKPFTVPTPCAAHAPHRTYRVVWFKRDLRVHDHAALAQAAAHGPVLCLYVLEPRKIGA